MTTLRMAADRGTTRLDWLDSKHTFSFGEYHDRRHMGFRALRVLNDDVIAPGAGFGTHGHRDMEILSFALSGGLTHRDSMGTGSTIRPGDVQRMTAGTGVRHSEMNASETEPAHFLQIWLVPERQGLEPGYEERNFDARSRAGEWVLVGSRDGRDGSLKVHQDVAIHRAHVPPGASVTTERAPDRHAWLHVATGRIRLHDVALEHVGTDSVELGPGDAAALLPGDTPRIEGIEDADVLLFDLA